jgi:hypothetical protein
MYIIAAQILGEFMVGRIAIVVTALVLVLSVVGPARAGEVHDFHDAVADATGHYRQAMFYLHTGNGASALFELDEMAAKWDAVELRFADNPPDTYDNDPTWSDALVAVGEAVVAGISAAEAGDVEAARAQLAPIRGALSGLRQRNGVFLFSDCIERANGAFERLFVYRHEPPDFAAVEAMDELRRTLAITAYWYGVCHDTAPALVADDPRFQRIMESARYSLGRMWDAMDKQDELRLINILRELKSSDGLLYLLFG